MFVFRAVDRENLLGDFNGVVVIIIIILYTCLIDVASKFQHFDLFDSGSRGRIFYIIIVSQI